MPNVTFLLRKVGRSGYRYEVSLTDVENTGTTAAKRRPLILMKLRPPLQASSIRSSQLPLCPPPSQSPSSLKSPSVLTTTPSLKPHLSKTHGDTKARCFLTRTILH